jgi:hypothetical protein
VAHVGEKLALRLRCRLGRFLGAAQQLVALDPIGNVAQERTEEVGIVTAHRRGNRDFEGKLVAAAVQAA